jgi:hypothetical protein
LVFVLVLSFGITVQAEVYSSENGDFTTRFWKEKFFGGGPGQPGNVLMAVGQGFVFQHAELQSAGASLDPEFQYETVYEGGQLILNSKGPWLAKGKPYKAKGLRAVNYSTFDGDTGFLKFKLVVDGEFKDGNCFQVIATYAGYPRVQIDESGQYVFQGDTMFEADITIPCE